jgi:replicative superfamily II helicase
MIGRAGRYGFDLVADSVLCAWPNERSRAVELTTRKLERVESCLGLEGRGLARVVLEGVGIGLVQDQFDMKEYLMSTLLYSQAKTAKDGDLSVVEEDKSNYSFIKQSSSDVEASKHRANQAWSSIQAQGKETLDFLIFNEIIS